MGCAQQAEVGADGKVKGLETAQKDIEGGLIRLEKDKGFQHEFLTAMFGGPIPKTEKAGAVGVLVVNTDISLSRMFGGDSKSNFVTIPVVMVSQDAGNILKSNDSQGSIKLQPNG